MNNISWIYALVFVVVVIAIIYAMSILKKRVVARKISITVTIYAVAVLLYCLVDGLYNHSFSDKTLLIASSMMIIGSQGNLFSNSKK